MTRAGRPRTSNVASATVVVRESLRMTVPSRRKTASGSASRARTVAGSRSREATAQVRSPLYALKYLLVPWQRRPQRRQSRSAQARVASSMPRAKAVGSGGEHRLARRYARRKR